MARTPLWPTLRRGQSCAVPAEARRGLACPPYSKGRDPITDLLREILGNLARDPSRRSARLAWTRLDLVRLIHCRHPLSRYGMPRLPRPLL